MIQVYEILSGGYNIDAKPFLKLITEARSRGNSRKLEKTRAKTSLRLRSFSERIVND